MPDPSAAGPWFEKARNDLRTAELLLAAGDYPADIVCFHSQQAAEKALKGALPFDGIIAPFTHDLVRLVALLPSHSAELLTDATSLSPYAVASRYPDANEKYDDAVAPSPPASESANSPNNSRVLSGDTNLAEPVRPLLNQAKLRDDIQPTGR